MTAGGGRGERGEVPSGDGNKADSRATRHLGERGVTVEFLMAWAREGQA